MTAQSKPISTGARDANVPLPSATRFLEFDVNDTLLDINALAPLFDRVFGERQMVRKWFNQLVMYSMALTLAGYYVDFFRLGQGVLQMSTNIHGAELTHDDLAAVKHAMLTMPAHVESKEALSTLRNNGFRLARQLSVARSVNATRFHPGESADG